MKSDMTNEPFQKFFNKFWELIKNYWIPEDTEEYWEGLIADIDKTMKPYGMTDAMRRLCLAFAESRETVLKIQDDKNIDRHKIVSLGALQKREVDGVNVITLNGEKYIKISSL